MKFCNTKNAWVTTITKEAQRLQREALKKRRGLSYVVLGGHCDLNCGPCASAFWSASI